MSLNAPPSYNSYFAVSPNDLQTLGTTYHKTGWGLWVGTGGHVSVVGSDGVTVVFKNVPSGTLLPIHVIQVNSAGTTAGDIVALTGQTRT
jgi:hypothetical protein